MTETATGIGALPLALLHQHGPGPVLRSSAATCFLVGELISLVILAVAGRTHMPQVTAALAHAELRNAVRRSKSPNDWYDMIEWLYGSTRLEGAVSNESRGQFAVA